MKTFKIELSTNHKFFIELKEYFLGYQKISNNELLKKYNLEKNIDKIINSIISSMIEEAKYDNQEVDLNSEINVLIYDDSNLCFDHSIGKALSGQDIGDLVFELTNIFYLYINENHIQKQYLIR